jgi:rubredoxin
MTEVKRGFAEECAYTECGTCFNNRDTPHCPECRRASVTSRNGGMCREKSGHVWRCETCGHEFDEPKWLRGNGTVRKDTLAGELHDMDPDTEIVHPDEVEQ